MALCGPFAFGSHFTPNNPPMHRLTSFARVGAARSFARSFSSSFRSAKSKFASSSSVAAGALVLGVGLTWSSAVLLDSKVDYAAVRKVRPLAIIIFT